MPEEAKKKEEAEELSTTFEDEAGRKWTPRLTLPIVDRYCREQGIAFGQLDAQRLSQAQLIDLVYEGIRYQTLFKADTFTREQFLEQIDGPAYTRALVAGQIAIANFSLRSLLTKPERVRAVASLQARIDAVMGTLKTKALDGLGLTLSESVPTPDADPATT